MGKNYRIEGGALPFLLKQKGAATQGERAALHLHVSRFPPMRGDPKVPRGGAPDNDR